MNNPVKHGVNMPVKRNAAKCDYCGDIVESKNRHDFVACSCWDDPTCTGEHIRYHGIFVDGGRDYIRHGFSDESEYINLSEFTEE